ncbi:MAG: hypothetical protein HFH34_01535 [Eubacterium sp.]|nr:hypothetical protein [Eubacterium sp.]
MFGENNCLLRFFVGKAVWQSGCVWERKAVWQSGRVRASGTGGQPGGIGLSGLGQRCGELIAQSGSPGQVPAHRPQSLPRSQQKMFTG